jgi:hypothetical protein
MDYGGGTHGLKFRSIVAGDFEKAKSNNLFYVSRHHDSSMLCTLVDVLNAVVAVSVVSDFWVWREYVLCIGRFPRYILNGSVG